MFACFLDASKAFDLVKNSIPFQKLVVRFLYRWYLTQELKVCWENVHSNKFSVSNGVRQGGVLSPILFSIYLDSLLVILKHADIDYSWVGEFSGALAYADDVVLLSLSASGLRLMLRVCEDFASSHGLLFNPIKTVYEDFASSHGLLFNPFKTQFIQFYHHSHLRMNSSILFCGRYIPLLNEVLHLGHILTYNLSDDRDILSKCKDMIRKANSLLCSFSNLSPIVLTYLFRSFCLSLYGCALWNISSKYLKTLEVSFNKLLRRIWNLPYNSHTRIVHGTAKLPSLFNLTFNRTITLFTTSKKCSSFRVKYIFCKSASCCFTFLDHNLNYGSKLCKTYSIQDQFRSDVIRDIRSAQPTLSFSKMSIESVINSLSTCTT